MTYSKEDDDQEMIELIMIMYMCEEDEAKEILKEQEKKPDLNEPYDSYYSWFHDEGFK